MAKSRRFAKDELTHVFIRDMLEKLDELDREDPQNRMNQYGATELLLKLDRVRATTAHTYRERERQSRSAYRKNKKGKS